MSVLLLYTSGAIYSLMSTQNNLRASILRIHIKAQKITVTAKKKPTASQLMLTRVILLLIPKLTTVLLASGLVPNIEDIVAGHNLRTDIISGIISADSQQ